MKRRLITVLIAICLIAILVPLTVSAAAPENGWYQEDGYWYYYRDGAIVQDEVLKIGNTYYGFDYDGRMYDNVIFWYDDNYYGATAGGPLCVNQWVQKRGEWFYFGAEARGACDFQQLGGVWYFFDRGRMCHDELVWSIDYQNYYVLSKSGTDSKALTTPGWHQAYGNWYYLYHDGMALCGAWDCIFNIGGVTYGFDYYGRLASNEILELYDYETDSYNIYYVNASGVVVSNGWFKLDGHWYYLADGWLYSYGIHEIGGKLYAFDQDGRLITTPGNHYVDGWEIYVKDSSGVLAHNEWIQVGSRWSYYGADAEQYYYGFYTIGDKLYFFDQGYMQKSTLAAEVDGTYYVLDQNGYATLAHGWFQLYGSNKWMYAWEGQLFCDGIYTIGGAKYSFNHRGDMLENGIDYDHEAEESYLFGADGKQITTPGWKKLNGQWYYIINSTGSLAEGLYTIGGVDYCFAPEMIANTILYLGDGYYAFNNNGIATRLTGTGWRNVAGDWVYLENGVPAAPGWKQIGSYWYYFYDDGSCVISDTIEINGAIYGFDMDGRWVQNGWYFGCYVKNGTLATGLQTIDGKQYLFDAYGTPVYGYQGEIVEYNGTLYWLRPDSSVKTTVTVGWNQVGGKWYYVETDNYSEQYVLLRNTLLWIDDVPSYGFDADGVMCAGGIRYAYWDYYMFDNDGHLLTGWQQIGGKWYYAEPEAYDPYLYNTGFYDIDGGLYYFKNNTLQFGSFIYGDSVYTTDGSGRIVSNECLSDGWHYVDGYAVYIKNGKPFSGWVGDYYVEDGYLYTNTIIEENGKYYYLKPDGRLLKSGWYYAANSSEEGYVYARADGSLCYNEWLQLGSSWYYFERFRMINQPIFEIDGQDHAFDKSGKWLGLYTEKTFPTKGDGWQMINGKWYYYHAGMPLTYCRSYIGGTWYGFDGDGAMVTNRVFDIFYYTASGAQATYTGWQKLNGQWYYFFADHTVATYMARINGKYYSFTENGVMESNTTRFVEGALYIFGADGSCSGPATGTGWRQAGSNWYYLVDGRPVIDQVITIGGATYAFDHEGIMITNDFYYGEAANCEGFLFFGASGARVTTPGWKQTSEGWVYIGSDGFLYFDGVYKIGSSVYSFANGLWVQ